MGVYGRPRSLYYKTKLKQTGVYESIEKTKLRQPGEVVSVRFVFGAIQRGPSSFGVFTYAKETMTQRSESTSDTEMAKV